MWQEDSLSDLKKRISEENDCSLTKCISQPSVDSLIRTLHRELRAKLFTSVCSLCCFCVQSEDRQRACVGVCACVCMCVCAEGVVVY